jgi:hypothetical protein
MRHCQATKRACSKRIHLALFLCVGFLGCAPSTRGRNGPGDHSGDTGDGDGGVMPTSTSADLSTGVIGTVYGDLGADDSGVCQPPAMPMMCASPIADDSGCGPVELCGPNNSGNGLDDNCNGQVDEGCGCTPGAVQPCFLGPPGKHKVGACTDGTQTCEGTEFASWGPCKGSIGPSAERCDNLDNDCNGCADDGLCCAPALDCPAPGDPRIADALPFSTIQLKGEAFFPGSAASWSWTVVGGPCDQLFSTTTGSPPVQSYTLTSANQKDATLAVTLSGDYTVTMNVVGTDGVHYSCTWVQHVVGPGVRVELCWDTTGTVDLDLHVHKPNSTTPFFNTVMGTTTTDSVDDCDYRNCKASSFSTAVPTWGYASSPLAQCQGGPEGALWTGIGSCRNPRLDIDNVSELGRPENVSIDSPKDGETFRTLIHYFGGGPLETHPLVNIYCGGSLKATFGQAPNQTSGFASSGDWALGDMWRVADVTANVNSSGVTTGCTVTALHPAGSTTGYLIGHDSKISYSGN